MESSGKGKKRKNYSLEFKLKVVQELSELSGERLAKKYSIHPRRIREWKKQKNDLIKAVGDKTATSTVSDCASTSKPGQGKRKRLLGGGRKVRQLESTDVKQML